MPDHDSVVKAIRNQVGPAGRHADLHGVGPRPQKYAEEAVHRRFGAAGPVTRGDRRRAEPVGPASAPRRSRMHRHLPPQLDAEGRHEAAVASEARSTGAPGTSAQVLTRRISEHGQPAPGSRQRERHAGQFAHYATAGRRRARGRASGGRLPEEASARRRPSAAQRGRMPEGREEQLVDAFSRAAGSRRSERAAERPLSPGLDFVGCRWTVIAKASRPRPVRKIRSASSSRN